MKVLASFIRNRRGMYRCGVVIALAVCLLLLAAPPRSLAQEFRATLTGQVTDPSGAFVAKAAVTAVNIETGSIYNAETSNSGVYYIPYVVPGTYTVTVKADGFKTSIQDKVLLLAGKYFNQNFKLGVGAIKETMEVTAAPPMLETANASGGTILDERTLQNVPVAGHQVYMLIGTVPGSQFTQQQFGPGGFSGTRGWDVTNQYIIGGGVNPADTSGGYNQFTLNGTNITQQTTYDNQGAGTWNVAPNLDAIQEVNVMTTTYDARYGRTTGGTVNMVSKNGTNVFHGTLYEGYRDGSLFDANSLTNVFISGAPTQQQVENQFTGTFGGPIKKDKLWFFFSFEGYRQSIYNTVTANVPPLYLRPGDPSNPAGQDVDFGLVQSLDPGLGLDSSGNQIDPYVQYGLTLFQPGDSTNPSNPNNAICVTGGPATACNQNNVGHNSASVYGGGTNGGSLLPSAQLNPTAMMMLQAGYIPKPNIGSAENFIGGFGEPANFFAVTPDYYSYNQPMIRVDFNTSEKTKWYSFFEWQKGHENRSGNGLTGIEANGNINWTRENWAASQDMIHTFSPTFLGDFKISFSRFVAAVPDGDLSAAKPASTIGLNMPIPPTTSLKAYPEYSIGGMPTIFGNSNNLDATTNVTLDADFTKSKGAHNIHFGGGAAYFTYGNPGNAGNANGTFAFSGQWTQFDPYNSNCYQPQNLQNIGSGCSGNYAPNGSGWADFLLGLPGTIPNGPGSAVAWNDSLFDYQPVWSLYGQDDWRVTRRLSVNLGLRYDVQIGLKERYNELTRGMCLTCVNPITTDGTYQANIASAASIAAWQAAGINPATLQTVYGGAIYVGRNGQPRNAYNTDWSNIAPRLGFAFAVNPKTVVRGGWGLMYGAGLEGGSPVGYQQTTSYTTSGNIGLDPVQGGAAPGSPSAGPYGIGSPYPSSAAYPLGLLPPVGANAGLLTGVGNNVSFDYPQRKIPRTQVMSFGFQRELPHEMTLDARWAGNYASRLRTFLWTNGKITYPQLQYALATNNAVYSQQVPNPYYGVFSMSYPGGCGNLPTVQAITLLLGFSQYCGGPGNGNTGEALNGQYNAPLGRNWYNGLEVKLTKRTSHGLTLNLAYTWEKIIDGDGYQNGWPYQDANQVHWISGYDRTHVLAVTGVYELPVGRGKMLLANAPKPLDLALGGWTVGWTFAAQSGTPVGINSGYNYSCNNFASPKGSSVAQWINPQARIYQATGSEPASCATKVPIIGGLANISYNTTPGLTPQVRTPTVPELDLSLEKDFRVTEHVKFTLRGEAFNAMNSVLLGGPDTNPTDAAASLFYNSTTKHSYWTGFGTVSPTQLNFPRNLRVSGKITF